MLDRIKIEKRLAKVPKEFAAVFAVRAAMRVLPMLVNNKGNKEVFGFWSEDKATHVFSVMHAHRYSFSVAAIKSVQDRSWQR